MENNILDANYSMLFGHLWLQDDEVTHNWDNNLITIGQQKIHTIIISKNLDSNTKWLKILLYYDLLMVLLMKMRMYSKNRTILVHN